jgi:hypothetical protein
VARQVIFESQPGLHCFPFRLLFTGAIVCKKLLNRTNAITALIGEWQNHLASGIIDRARIRSVSVFEETLRCPLPAQ